MGAQHVVAVHLLPDGPDPLSPLDRGGEPDGVGDVKGSGAIVDRDAKHVAHEIKVRPGGILGAELHIVGVFAGPGHRRGGLGQHLVGAHLQFVFHVGGAGGDEDVDAPPFGRLDGFPTPVDIGVAGPGQPADHRAPHRGGDGVDGLEVTLAGDREAGFDVVDPQTGQLGGDFQFLPHVE